MPRFRDRVHVELDGGLEISLLIGRTDFDDVSDEQLEVGWQVYGERLMGYGRIVGTRPWGYWVFELGEDMPRGGCDKQTMRLAEQLTPDELAALRERANEARLRIGTPAEVLSDGRSMDRGAVELFEAVRKA